MVRKEYLDETKNNNILRHLALSLRASVRNEQPPLLDDDTDFRLLLKFAERHAVLSAVYESVKCSNCPEDILKKWSDKVGLAINKEILFDNELCKVEKVFTDAKIKFVPIKGIVIKKLYPKLGMRQFCDYDILIESSKSDLSKEKMKSLNYVVSRDRISEEKAHSSIAVIDCHKSPIFNFELHKKLFHGVEEGYFKNIWERVDFPYENPYKGKMRDEDVYLYHLAHLRSHLEERSGAGIRYLADHYLIKEKLLKKDDDTNRYIKKILEEENLVDFEKEIDAVTYDLFSSPVDEVDFNALEAFLLYGIHGSLENKANLGVKKEGRVVFTLKRIFPPYTKMAEYYYSLKKFPILLPFYYVHRFFSILVNKSRRNAAKSEMRSAWVNPKTKSK